MWPNQPWNRGQKDSWIKLKKASSILTRTATQHFFYFLKISDVRDKKKQSTGYFVWKLQKLNELEILERVVSIILWLWLYLWVKNLNITRRVISPVSELEDWMDDRLEEEDSEMDLLLWMSTPTSSLRSSKRRLRYLKKWIITFRFSVHF